MEPIQTSIFQETEQDVFLDTASTGQRFVNYLVDTALFYIVYLFFMACLGVVLALTMGGDGTQEFLGSTSFKILNYLIALITFLILYTLIERLSKGRSLGKIITKTKVIREDGQPIIWKDAFYRSLSRIVPFEVLSGLSGYPWHDKWTQTRVVIKR